MVNSAYTLHSEGSYSRTQDGPGGHPNKVAAYLCLASVTYCTVPSVNRFDNFPPDKVIIGNHHIIHQNKLWTGICSIG